MPSVEIDMPTVMFFADPLGQFQSWQQCCWCCCCCGRGYCSWRFCVGLPRSELNHSSHIWVWQQLLQQHQSHRHVCWWHGQHLIRVQITTTRAARTQLRACLTVLRVVLADKGAPGSRLESAVHSHVNAGRDCMECGLARQQACCRQLMLPACLSYTPGGRQQRACTLCALTPAWWGPGWQWPRVVQQAETQLLQPQLVRCSMWGGVVGDEAAS